MPMAGALRRIATAVVLLGASGGCSSDPAQKPPATTAAPVTLSAQHPGDRGLGQDPAVLFYEDFAESNPDALFARYTAVKNKSGMALLDDHPPASPSGHSLQFTAGGGDRVAYLYQSFGRGYEELYIRFYAKWLDGGPWHHSGVWFGGNNPPLPYPFPRAGSRPAGDDFFWLAFEPVGNGLLDLYVSWMQMHTWKAANAGPHDYYGNTLIHKYDFRYRSDAWDCFEIHLKLNPDPASGAGAVLEVWKNDALVQRFDDKGPLGYLVRDKFCPWDADDPKCASYRPAKPIMAPLDQRWRSTPALGIDYVWLQNYSEVSAPSSMRLADVAVASRRIGCITRG